MAGLTKTDLNKALGLVKADVLAALAAMEKRADRKFVTKEDLQTGLGSLEARMNKRFATKDDLAAFEHRANKRFAAKKDLDRSHEILEQKIERSAQSVTASLREKIKESEYNITSAIQEVELVHQKIHENFDGRLKVLERKAG